MGIISRLVKGKDLVPAITAVDDHAALAPTFAEQGVSIDSGVLYGLPSIDDYIRGIGRATRKKAMSITAVKKARDRVAGGIGQFPIELYDREGVKVDWNLFTQPEDDKPRSISMTQLVDDMLFHGVGWWQITHVGWHGYPVQCRRLDPSTVTIQKQHIVYAAGTSEEWIPNSNVIRFDSPYDAILEAGWKAIHNSLALADFTGSATEALPPMSYFTPEDDVDPLDDEEIKVLLAMWVEARKKYGIAYVPAALKLNSLGWNPEQLQLEKMRNQAAIEITNLFGVDPEDVGVSTTSRTYANLTDRRRDFLDFTLGPIMTAIEDRLEMNDVTPRGFTVDFVTDEFTRANDLERAQTDKILVDAGILLPDEAREKRHLDPLGTPANNQELEHA